MTPQRKDFAEILKRLVQRNYEKSLKSILQYKLEYLGEDPESEGVTVHTRASSTTDQRDEPVAIDYRLTEANGTWKVLDIVTEGSSLVNNYKKPVSPHHPEGRLRHPGQAHEREARQGPGVAVRLRRVTSWV